MDCGALRGTANRRTLRILMTVMALVTASCSAGGEKPDAQTVEDAAGAGDVSNTSRAEALSDEEGLPEALSGGQDVEAASDAEVASPDVLVGAFLVQFIEERPETAWSEAQAAFTYVFGSVYDGPTPNTTLWEEVSAAGDCRLLKPSVPFCEGGCGAGACVDDGTCMPYPAPAVVGTVTVTGLINQAGDKSFSMEPLGGFYQPPGGEQLPYPAAQEGDAISLAAKGSPAVPAFTLEASGVAPLVLLNESVPVEPESPVVLQWVPPGIPGLSTVSVKLDISHHAGSKGKILCDTLDDGLLEIEAALVDQLVALGVAGFPTILVTRKSTGSTMVPTGRIDLEVSADVEVLVDIPGNVSCTSDENCPEGQTCQVGLFCK